MVQSQKRKRVHAVVKNEKKFAASAVTRTTREVLAIAVVMSFNVYMDYEHLARRKGLVLALWI